MTDALARLDAALVNAFQGGFPICERPFEVAAAALREHGVEAPTGEEMTAGEHSTGEDLTGARLVDRVRALVEDGTLSRFGPLVNADEIGGTATLVAMHAPDDRFEEVVAAVNDHTEVAHNYERDHPHLNVWFVVSVADAGQVERVLDAIEAETGQPTYNLPKQTEFRVKARFPVEGPFADEGLDLTDHNVAVPDVDTDADGATSAGPESGGLTADERDLVVAIQDGLPITETPYADVAADPDRDPDWVRTTLERFRQSGKVRRVGVVPNHYALGYEHNPMTVWDVPDDVVADVGPELAALPFVTHCYERPRHDGVWPYNVFAMTHGRSAEEADRRVERIRSIMADHWDVDDEDWGRLTSTQILKKTGIRIGERADASVDADAADDGLADDASGDDAPAADDATSDHDPPEASRDG